ncbi:hypothetical protein Tco_0169233 [Tanacetum coccineum]
MGAGSPFLKSVLTILPLILCRSSSSHGILKKTESSIRNFFNGHDGRFSRKSSWFNWNKALASKKNGRPSGSDILQAVNSLKDKGIDFLQFIRKKIGNGVNISFWADSWIGSIPFKEKFPRLYALEESKSISVADKLGLSSLYLSFRRPPRGGIEQESFNLLCQSVRGLVLSNIEDRWSWSLEGSGLFSVKSSRAYIDDLLLPKADAATRWIRILPIKINVFAWKGPLHRCLVDKNEWTLYVVMYSSCGHCMVDKNECTLYVVMYSSCGTTKGNPFIKLSLDRQSEDDTTENDEDSVSVWIHSKS